MKYRVLTEDEFEALKDEFVKFLIVQGIDAASWQKMKDLEPDLAQKYLHDFSDFVFENTLQKIGYIDFFNGNSLKLFKCASDDIQLINIESVSKLIPLSALVLKTLTLTWPQFWDAVTAPRVMASYRLTFGASLIATLVNVVPGLLVAWVLVRYPFPGKKFVDALVDLPFALPTAVAGIALTTLYSEHGWIGSRLAPLGIKVAFTELGIIVALTFIGLPFVVRTLQPVLQDLESEIEEAAASLGATRLQTFQQVLVPALWPALLTGFALAFARAIGEYGSVVFISGRRRRCPWRPECRRWQNSVR